MKISWSYLAIVAISIGCVFSSCQSKVNNPSHNESDSTNTSVAEVDSAAIIAEQKQKEAETLCDSTLLLTLPFETVYFFFSPL